MTWAKNILVDEAADKTERDFTAYSDLVKINSKKIGVLYERNGYRQIVFTVIKWK
jgi:sialidase-1